MHQPQLGPFHILCPKGFKQNQAKRLLGLLLVALWDPCGDWFWWNGLSCGGGKSQEALRP